MHSFIGHMNVQVGYVHSKGTQVPVWQRKLLMLNDLRQEGGEKEKENFLDFNCLTKTRINLGEKRK